MKGTASRSRWEIISSHIFTYFNFLNLVLAGLILVSGQYKNMLFMGIVITNAVIGIKGKTDHRCAVGCYSDKSKTI